MHTKQREHDPGVIQRLLDEPQRFGFFQAVRLLERWLTYHGVPDGAALRSCIRFVNSISFAFPNSEIEAIRAGDREPIRTERELAEAIRLGLLPRVFLRPSFMGYLGVQGTMPLHVTDAVRRRMQSRDGIAARTFFDILANRILGLFFRAWCKSRPDMRRTPTGDVAGPLMLALAGRQKGIERAGIANAVAIFHASALRQRAPSAAVLQNMLEHYLGVPVRITPNQGGWEVLPDKFQMRLSAPNARLGGPCVLGDRMWRRDVRVSVALGPLSREQYLHFIPSQPGARTLASLLSLFALSTLIFNVRLLVRREAVCGAVLDGAVQLGRDSFLMQGLGESDRDDICYAIPNT